MHHSAYPRRAGIVCVRSPSPPLWGYLTAATLILVLQSPPPAVPGFNPRCLLSAISAVASRLDRSSWVQKLGGIRTAWERSPVPSSSSSITLHGDTAHAQLFNQAEQQTNTIFGQYIDAKIVTFLFGLLRVVVWISAVGFVLFAVYQAQRGEQWQPLMQNAFIVIAAIVVVEGLSSLFFGGGTKAGG
jgi:hypothetical protein